MYVNDQITGKFLPKKIDLSITYSNKYTCYFKFFELCEDSLAIIVTCKLGYFSTPILFAF